MAKKKMSKKNKESIASKEHVHSDECLDGYSSEKDQKSCIRKAKKDWQEMVKKVYPPYIKWRETHWEWDDNNNEPQETISVTITLRQALSLDALMVSYAAVELRKEKDINTNRLFNCFDRSKFLAYVISRGGIQFDWNEETCEEEDIKQQLELMNEIRKELRLLFSDKDSTVKRMVEDYGDEEDEDNE